MKVRIYIFLAAVAIALASCSGVKNLAKPDLQLPTELAGNSTDSITAADIDWMNFFADPQLVEIIKETLAHNRNFLAAAARVEEMRQLYGVTASNFFPTLSANAYGNQETNDYHDEKHVTDPEYGLKATLSWEADLWGGLKWARRKGGADFRASVEQERAMRITLIAEAASAYFRLIALDNELQIAKRTLFTREENLQKAKIRFEGGMTPETVYRQAEVEYATTAALIPGLESRIETQKNAIALLMGRFPQEEIARGTLLLRDSLPKALPVGLPSQLMQRRPDIRAAEAKLQGALADVGVAYADRFPRLRIGLTGGWENNELGGFFKSPFSYVVGSITGTILDFGRNKRKYKSKIAAYDQARLAYEQTVLTAFHEVDDAATTLRKVNQTCDRRRELLEAAQAYARLAYRQYNAGAINYIDVLDAQRRFYDAQVGMSNAMRDQCLAIVNLYKALGGGWHSEEL